DWKMFQRLHQKAIGIERSHRARFGQRDSRRLQRLPFVRCESSCAQILCVADFNAHIALELFLKAGQQNDAASMSPTIPAHAYEVHPRKDKRGVDLISHAMPFCRLRYDGPNAFTNAIGYATDYSHSHNAVIRVDEECGNVIETHEHAGDFKELS